MTNSDDPRAVSDGSEDVTMTAVQAASIGTSLTALESELRALRRRLTPILEPHADDPFANLAQALRRMRTRQHRRLQDVAKAAGITKAMLSSFETGRRVPSLPSLAKVLTALDADFNDLQMVLDRFVEDPPPDAQRAVERLDTLGVALQALRKDRRRDRESIVADADITSSMLSAYESGSTMPSIATLGKLLRALDADLRDLHEALLASVRS